MKTELISALRFFMLLVLLTFTSCEDDKIQDFEAKELIITLPETVPSVGYTRRETSFPVQVVAGAGLAKIEQRRDFETVPGSEKSTFENPYRDTYMFSYIPPDDEAGTTQEFTFVVTDTKGYSRTKTFKLDIELTLINITISIPESAPAKINHKETLEFDIPVESEYPLDKIEVYKDDQLQTAMSKTEFASSNADIYRFSYEAEELAAGENKEITFRMVVTDELGQAKEAAYVLQVKGPRLPLAITRFDGIQLGGSSNNSVPAKFADAHTGGVYGLDDGPAASADIDIAYYVGSSDATVICNPADNTLGGTFVYKDVGSWPVRNNTRFVRVPEDNPLRDNFYTVTDDSEIYAAFEAGPDAGKFTNVLVGDVLVFKTVDGLLGALRVTQESGTNKFGTVTFDMITQNP